MDVVVLLIFAAFFTTLVVSTFTGDGLLRAAVRRPRLFRAALLGAAVATVPLDLYVVLFGTLGPGGAPLSEVADPWLLLNVAAACGVAALHESLRDDAVAASAPLTPRGTSAAGRPGTEPAVRMGVLGWVGPLTALAVVTTVMALEAVRNGPELGNMGPVWACYSLLICMISATALLRRRVREAIDPREG
jgi:hypothetical protein